MRTRVAIALGTVYVVWGSTYLAIAVADRTLPPLLMLAVRFGLAGGLLYGWSLWRGDVAAARPGRREWAAAAIVGGLLLFVETGAVAWAEQRVASGLTALLVASVPLFTALLDRTIFGVRLSLGALAGIACGLLGVAVLAGPSAHIDPVGAAVLLGGAFAWAAGSAYARVAPLPSAPFLSTAMQMLCGAALLGVAGAATGEVGQVHPGAISAGSLAAFAFLVVVGSIGAYTAYGWLLRSSTRSVLSRPMRTSTRRSRCCSAGSSPARLSAAGSSPPARSSSPRSGCSFSRAPRRRGDGACWESRLFAASFPEQDPRPRYGGGMTSFDLRKLRLRSGDQARERVEIELEPLALGGQTYEPRPNPASAELGVTRASSGTVLELELDVSLAGPCFRCLVDAELPLSLRLREYEATKPKGDEMRTEYLEGDKLDLSAWARDAIALALPDKILCRADCAGLCPVCGKDLNAEPHEHAEEIVDPRWEKLSELRGE